MRAIIYDLVVLINSKKTELNIPNTVRMDRLMETGDSISIAMRGLPKTLKEYINGTRQRVSTFDVLAVTDEGNFDKENLDAVEWLESIGNFFEAMSRYALSTNRTVMRASQITIPTIVGRSDNGRVSYVMTVTIEYEERDNGTTN